MSSTLVIQSVTAPPMWEPKALRIDIMGKGSALFYDPDVSIECLVAQTVCAIDGSVKNYKGSDWFQIIRVTESCICVVLPEMF